MAAKFRFGKDSKTTSAKVRWQKHKFQYQGDKTLVKDANGDETIFEHNASGITTAVTNAEGVISQIELSDRNQIIGLMHNNVQQAKIVYDKNGRPLRYDINAKPTAMERNFAQYSYRYDGEGRALSIEAADKTLVNYEYDVKGNLTRHKTVKFDRSYQYADNGDVLVEIESYRGLPANTTIYSYNADGLMASLTATGQTARFDYNAVGRLSKVTFPDGSSHQYQYDKLGFRTQTTRSDHCLVDYVYDKVGNLTQSIKRTTAASEGKINGLTLNAQNQVTKVTNDGKAAMSVKYSAKGNPVKITQGDNSTEYQYDDLGRLTGVTDSNKGQANYEYQADEEDIRLQFDDRTKGASSTQTKVTGHNQTQAQLHPQKIVFETEAQRQLRVKARAPDYESKRLKRMQDFSVLRDQLYRELAQSNFMHLDGAIIKVDINKVETESTRFFFELIKTVYTHIKGFNYIINGTRIIVRENGVNFTVYFEYGRKPTRGRSYTAIVNVNRYTGVIQREY